MCTAGVLFNHVQQSPVHLDMKFVRIRSYGMTCQTIAQEASCCFGQAWTDRPFRLAERLSTGGAMGSTFPTRLYMRSRPRQQLIFSLSADSRRRGNSRNDRRGPKRHRARRRRVAATPTACGRVAPTGGGGTESVPACGGMAPTSRNRTMAFSGFLGPKPFDSN